MSIPIPGLLTDENLRDFVRGRIDAAKFFGVRSQAAWARKFDVDEGALSAFLKGSPPPPRLLAQLGFRSVVMYRQAGS